MLMKRARGVTMIEMVIGIAILAILTAMAAPNFTRWIENMKIRTTAESVLSGLQRARAEALKGNSSVNFLLTGTAGACVPSTSGPHWIVSSGYACNASAIVQVYNGKPDDKAGIVAGQSFFVFAGLGRLVTPAANIDVHGAEGEDGCLAKNGRARCLRIEVGAEGGIRMCDPALPTTKVQAC
jgi:type IV fimbrial biogenesis protein FimT